MNIRLVPTHISLVYAEASLDKEAYEKEYQQLSESDSDPINQWLKLAKGRGETSETDPVLLNLIMELHRKVDALEMFLKNEEPKRVSLSSKEDIDSIGFEYLNIDKEVLQEGAIYYGRVEMPVHPKRDVPIFFEAITKTLAKIVKIHERDEKEWSAYLTARERILIREAKDKK
jgi:hypothetical protein